MQSSLEQTYGAIERCYAEGKFEQALELALALRPELASGRPDLLDQRLQLLIGHIHLYGLAAPAQAEQAYNLVLHSCEEADYRRLAEQGMAVCRQQEEAAPLASKPASEQELPQPPSTSVALPATPWLSQLVDPQRALDDLQPTQPKPGDGTAANPWQPGEPPVAQVLTPQAPAVLMEPSTFEPIPEGTPADASPMPPDEAAGEDLEQGLLMVRLSSR